MVIEVCGVDGAGASLCLLEELELELEESEGVDDRGEGEE